MGVNPLWCNSCQLLPLPRILLSSKYSQGCRGLRDSDGPSSANAGHPAWSNGTAIDRLGQVRSYKGGRHRNGTEEARITASVPTHSQRRLPSPVVYEGAYSPALRSVKLLSLGTCVLSLTLGPVITFFTLPGVNIVAKGALASLMMLMSSGTTMGLHWFTSPYVHKLTWQKEADEVEVQLLTWMATSVTTRFKLTDVKHAETQRPLVTFEAGGRYYYVDKDTFPDAKLLAKLSPDPRGAMSGGGG